MLSKILLLIALVALVAANNNFCGTIFDGEIIGTDLDIQTSTTTIKASWDGFNNVLRYEWAVISQNQASNIKDDRECRLIPGFKDIPDTLSWQNVELAKSASAKVNLKVGNTYYVILRVTTDLGVQKYVNSNGITVEKLERNVEVSKPTQNTKIVGAPASVPRYEKKGNSKEVKREAPGQPLIFSSGGILIGSTCPIDQENRCSAAKVSVGAFLTEIYGLPQYAQDERQNTIFTTSYTDPGQGYGVKYDPFAQLFPTLPNDDDDDGDHVNSGAIIGIALGVTAFFCILIIAIILITSIIGNLSGRSDNYGGSGKQSNVEEF